MTKKKVTAVEAKTAETPVEKVFKPTEENHKKAKQLRITAMVLWVIAIALEVVAILQLKNTPINLWLMIGLMVADAIFAIIGSILWKKANRLDPASEKDKVRFFVQNQLGMLMAVIAFLPLVVLLLTNKDLEAKDKGILTGVAVVALAIAAIFGVDLNPASIEQYTKEAALVESLMGDDAVFWTKSGRVYHLYDDCYTINTNKTEEIFSGKVSAAHELKNIEEICKICLKKAEAANGTAQVEDDHSGHSHDAS